MAFTGNELGSNAGLSGRGGQQSMLTIGNPGTENNHIATSVKPYCILGDETLRIEIASAVDDAPYIRHARIETLKTVGVEFHPAMAEPLATAQYLIAYDGQRPIGMAETAFLNEVYGSYADAPYHRLCDMNAYCPLDQMAGTRTVYADPDYRCSSLFMALSLGMAKLTHGLGARFSTATTNCTEQHLKTLYAKCGGIHVGDFATDHVQEQASLFVFDLEKAVRHRVMRRVEPLLAFESNLELVAN